MNRSIIIFLTIILLFSFTIGLSAQQKEQNNQNLNNSIFYSPDYNSIDINDYILRLPESEMALDFESQYQNRLKELADRYGNEQNNLLDIVFADQEIDSRGQNESIIYQPTTNININVDYDVLEEEDRVENKTAFEVNYSLDERTDVSAGYEFQNISNKQNQSDELDSIDSRYGISYQTTDNVKIFADYIYNDLLQNTGESTVFGMEYNLQNSIISAEYQIGNEITPEGTLTGLRTTGLTYQYQDMATFSASYKLLDPEEVTAQLREEKTWDFGVDVNLNEESSFSIGLQVINKDIFESGESSDGNNSSDYNEDLGSENDEQTKVEASFKINF